MQVADSRMTASVGWMIRGSSRSPPRTPPAGWMTTPRMSVMLLCGCSGGRDRRGTVPGEGDGRRRDEGHGGDDGPDRRGTDGTELRVQREAGDPGAGRRPRVEGGDGERGPEERCPAGEADGHGDQPRVAAESEGAEQGDQPGGERD